VADAFTAGESAFRRVDAREYLPASIGTTSTLVEAGNLRLWPHLHSTDGFFAAIWLKSPA
jgi:16S rRNA (cytosine967-C5)-methyltransferase